MRTTVKKEYEGPVFNVVIEAVLNTEYDEGTIDVPPASKTNVEFLESVKLIGASQEIEILGHLSRAEVSHIEGLIDDEIPHLMPSI